MNYTLTNFSSDRYYVGFKYPEPVTSMVQLDLPGFWVDFSKKFMKDEVSHLVEKKEAIGYMRFNTQGSKSFEYYAACEVTEFGDTYDFHKIVIPKGKYLFFSIPFSNKDEEIEAVLHYIRQDPSFAYKVNHSFCFEYYPETFHHEEEDTSLYFVVPIT